MTSLSDIWGAKDKPVLEETLEPELYEHTGGYFKSIFRTHREAMLLVHDKIVAVHTEFDGDVTMVDNQALFKTTTMSDASWRAILNCDPGWFDQRPVNSKKLHLVAGILLGLTCREWLHISATNMHLFELEK